MQVVDAPDHHPLIARIFDWAQLATRRAYETLFRRARRGQPVRGARARARRRRARADQHVAPDRAPARGGRALALRSPRARRSRCGAGSPTTRASPDERDVQRAETDADAIRVLTIHKAKGLEAPYVFLFGGTARAPQSRVQTLRDAVGRALVVGMPDAPTKERSTTSADAENQRLAYVALTRAQIRLYLPLYGEQRRRTAMRRTGRSSAASSRARGGRGGRRAPAVRDHRGRRRRPRGAAGAGRRARAASSRRPPPPPTELAPLAGERGGLADAVVHAPRERRRAPPRSRSAPATRSRSIRPSSTSTTPPARSAPDDLPPGAGLRPPAPRRARDRRPRGRCGASPMARRVGRRSGGRGASSPTPRARVASPPRYLPHAARSSTPTLTAPLALTDGHELPPLVARDRVRARGRVRLPARRRRRGAPARPRARASSTRSSRGTTSCGSLDYKSDLLAGDDLGAAAQRRVREHYAVQARLYAIAADRMRGPRTPRRPAVRVRAPRRRRPGARSPTTRSRRGPTWLADDPAARRRPR